MVKALSWLALLLAVSACAAWRPAPVALPLVVPTPPPVAPAPRPAPAAPRRAAAAPRRAATVPIVGVGHIACSDAWGADRKAETFAWVTGFWTGMNSASGSRVGSWLDGDGIVAAVEDRCTRRPSSTVYEATVAAYLALRAGR